MITRINHITIRTGNAAVMQNFYSEILGLKKDLRRPDHFAGFHLRSMVPSGEPIVHVMTGEDAQTNDGSIPTEKGGAVHHLAFYCEGYNKVKDRLVKYGIDWREYRIPEFGIWQIFVFDPHGILIELTFEAAVEGVPEPQIPKGLNFDPRDMSWFRPASYEVFGRLPA